MRRRQGLSVLGGELGQGTFSMLGLLHMGTEPQHDHVSEPDAGGVVGALSFLLPAWSVSLSVSGNKPVGSILFIVLTFLTDSWIT